jgi:hypothetical protein
MRKGIYYILLILFFIALGPLAGKAMAGQLEDLEARIEVNEARLDDNESNFKTFMDVGGYFDVMYVMTDQDATADKFRVHHLNLQLAKELSEGWSFFTEIEYEDGPKIEFDDNDQIEEASGALMVETMYVDAEVNHYVTLRMGRYLDPAGIWTVNHYAPFVPTMVKPLLVGKVFPSTLDGLQAFGSKPLGSSYTGEYKLYTGNGFGEPGKLDSNSNKAAGGSFNLKFLSLYDLNIGLSAYRDSDTSDTKIDALGADVQFRVKSFAFQGEYANAERETKTNVNTRRAGWYAQGIYDIKKVSLIYRYDTYRDTAEANRDHDTNTVAINYHFTPNIVAKLEHNMHKLTTTEDFNQTIATLAVFLGK